MASRGSVIPLFTKQIWQGKPITITDPAMTRFMMTLDEAVELVIYAFEHGNPGEIFVQKSPASTIKTLTIALRQLLNVPDHPVSTIGTRHGEKLYESLMSREEVVVAKDIGKYFKITPDLRNLNYENYFETGQIKITDAVEYTSHNTKRLNVENLKKLLLKLKFIQENISAKYTEPDE